MSRKSMIAALAAALVLVGVSRAPAAPLYEVLDLGTLGGTTTVAYDVNNSGQVVGYSLTATGDARAFRTAANTSINPSTDDLGTLDGNRSIARGINDIGEVVGDGHPSGGGLMFRTEPNANIDPSSDKVGNWRRGSPEGGWAYAVNASGQVAGWTTWMDPYNSSLVDQAYRTSPEGTIDARTDYLGTLAGDSDRAVIKFSYAYDINDSGQVVGQSTDAYGGYCAFRTGPNAAINPLTDNLATDPLTDILSYPHYHTSYSSARAINNEGRVVGYADFTGGVHAFLTAPNATIDPLTDDLGTLGGSQSAALDINESSEVVGHAQVLSGEKHAFVYDGVKMWDLNDLIDPQLGVLLSDAQAINDLGQIVANGSDATGAYHAFLLTPVPEPSTLALAAVALTAVGAAIGRRRIATACARR